MRIHTVYEEDLDVQIGDVRVLANDPMLKRPVEVIETFGAPGPDGPYFKLKCTLTGSSLNGGYSVGCIRELITRANYEVCD